MPDFTRAILALLPKGPAWTRAVGSKLEALVDGAATEFGRVNDRAGDLLTEADPRTCDETIDDWERVYGLPDSCVETELTALDDRRAALTARVVAAAGPGRNPSTAFFDGLLEALGYDLDLCEIRRFHRDPFTCESACDDALDPDEGPGWIFVWEFVLRAIGSLDETALCQIERYAYEHIGVTAAFPLVQWSEGTFARSGTATHKHPETLLERSLAADEMGRDYYGI